jgi:8-oxo-dGTP pyrophosphatase MutT (NUDIX family)
MQLIPASVVAILRNALPGPEVLLVHRSPDLPIQGGAWAFPGGRVAKQDGSVDKAHILNTALTCAVREVEEETGLRLEKANLILLAHWVTPPEMTLRFSSRIFITAGKLGPVKVDGREIIGHRWCTARQALEMHNSGHFRLTPPVFMILANFISYTDVDAILSAAKQRPPIRYEPRLVTLSDGYCALYREDIAYADKNINRHGPRHRLWARTSGWLYERFENP